MAGGGIEHTSTDRQKKGLLDYFVLEIILDKLLGLLLSYV